VNTTSLTASPGPLPPASNDRAAVPPGSGWPGDPATAATPVARDPAEVRALAAGAGSLAEVAALESVCRACDRLVRWREEVAATRRRSFAAQAYWGRPVPGCSVLVTRLDDPGTVLTDGAGWGELLVHAPWMFDGYDAAWSADADTWAVHDGLRFHRTGDVGYVEDGLVMHLGRRRHVIESADGALASVAVEGPVTAATGRLTAAVGVGPVGHQVLCVVVDGGGRLRVAGHGLREVAREASAHRIAAVLEGPLPVDRRHQSKIDRTALAEDVAAFLAGR